MFRRGSRAHRDLGWCLSMGGLNVIRKEAWLFCRTTSVVRLCWELEERKGPKGSELGFRARPALPFRLRVCAPRVEVPERFRVAGVGFRVEGSLARAAKKPSRGKMSVLD